VAPLLASGTGNIRADEGCDCGAAEIQRSAENPSRWPDMNTSAAAVVDREDSRLRPFPPAAGHSAAILPAKSLNRVRQRDARELELCGNFATICIFWISATVLDAFS
jgi:hypothetical protein